ncbi:MAG: hypothetical protein HY248_01235 [Fimbriimonas ginsengisoli]|nr:hypothetical protein [Fimbriimonas ginsengisoli]
MMTRTTLPLLAGLLFTTTLAMAPATANADNRQVLKNSWRNVAYGSAGLGIYGLLTGQNNLALIGAAGTAYAANRYEQDRRSQADMSRFFGWRGEDRRGWLSSRDRFVRHRHFHTNRGNGRGHWDRRPRSVWPSYNSAVSTARSGFRAVSGPSLR